MEKHSSRFLGAAAMLVALVSCTTLSSNPPAITGTVVDMAGNPLPGVAVSCAGPEERNSATNRDGRYAFAGLMPGEYVVSIQTGDTPAVPGQGRRRLSLEEGSVETADFALFAGDLVLIPAIQGRAHLSPLTRKRLVGIPGVVTAIRGRLGFYMQNPFPDDDSGTSEGLFVYAVKMPELVPGDLVIVDGKVQEFYTGGQDSGDLSVTRLRMSDIRLLGRGMEVPDPIVLGSGGRIPPDRVICNDAEGSVERSAYNPEEDAMDFYESMEGMLVRVNDAIVVGSIHTAYGEFHVVADKGAHASSPTRRGGLVLSPGDFNPEKITVDAKAEPDIVFQGDLDITVGDRFGFPIVGPLDYNYSDYKIIPVHPLTPITKANLKRETALNLSGPATLTCAAFNVLNFAATSPREKVDDLAATIVQALHSPDILALSEIQDGSGPTDDGVVSAALTYEYLISAIRSAGGPSTYDYREVAPQDGKDGGEPGGNIRVGFLFNTERVRFVDRKGANGDRASVTVSNGRVELLPSPARIDPQNPAFTNSRKPLAGEFEFRGEPVYVVAAHLGSKSGDPQVFARIHPLDFRSEPGRIREAQAIHGFVTDILAVDPQARVIVMGDLNDFAFSAPVVALKGDALYDLAEELLPLTERYTYVYRGNSQDLDHILVSRSLLESNPRVQILHRYAEYLYGVRQSDHDPILAAFDFE